jgi:O-antigen/teichoic acid export membrane protein
VSPKPQAQTVSIEGDQARDARTARRGGVLYFGASLLSQAAALVRYVVLARLLGPEQLGVAATLVVTASFFDLISDTGSDRFLIQDRDGDAPAVQKLVQLVYAGRGLAIALCLAAFAVPVAIFYKTPALAGGLVVLALSPLILGFQHLDYRRAQRAHDFRPEAICVIFAECVSLLATVTAAWLTRSFHAVLYGLITRAVVLVVVSHVQARRPYGFGWDLKHGRRLSRFALPLMLNGLMLFVINQGDRVIIGRELGVEALGYYSAVMLLIFYPSVLLARYIHAIYIPLVAAERDSAQARARVIDELGGQTVVLAIAMALGFALVAPPIIPVLFGARFAQDSLLVTLIGLLQTARFLLNWPSTASLANGRSATVLAGNLTHVIAFAAAVAGLKLVGGVQGLVGGFVVGEVVCAGLAVVLLNRDTVQPQQHGLERLVLFALACAAALLWNLTVRNRDWTSVGAAAIASALLLAGLWRRERASIRSLTGIVGRLAGSVAGRLANRSA